MNLEWRKMTQRHYSVEFFLMEAGHTKIHIDIVISTKILCSTVLNEPRCEKTGLRGIRPCPTQTRLCSDRKWLEA